jgi:hypothetical protein
LPYSGFIEVGNTFCGEGLMNMPWFNNPAITCKVLDRIANRVSQTNLQDLNRTLDRATELIWSKQEDYYMRKTDDKQE